MNENIKKVEKEVVAKGDSTKVVDEKKEKVSIEERIIPGEYRKITDYSLEEIKSLPRFKVTFSCKERVYNGNISYYPSLVLSLGAGFDLYVKSKEFTLITYTNLKENHLVPNLGMDIKAESFEVRLPVRFCKGQKENSDGTISVFYYAQIIVKKGTIFSVYINRKDGGLELFESRVNKGEIPFNGWMFNDKVKSAVTESDDNDYNYEWE